MLLAGRTPDQIAYFVPDIRAAAAGHARMFGSGPFYAVDSIAFSSCFYRGEPTDWDQGSAFGQWGNVMVEFMQQNRPGDSVLHDIYPAGSGRYGVHHMAYIVDDPPALAAAFEREGHVVALHGELSNGIEVFMLDTVAIYGHMIELYAPSPALLGIYDFVRAQAQGFDGSDPVRPFSFD